MPKASVGEIGLVSIEAYTGRFDSCDCVRLLDFNPHSRDPELDSDGSRYGSGEGLNCLIC